MAHQFFRGCHIKCGRIIRLASLAQFLFGLKCWEGEGVGLSSAVGIICFVRSHAHFISSNLTLIAFSNHLAFDPCSFFTEKRTHPTSLIQLRNLLPREQLINNISLVRNFIAESGQMFGWPSPTRLGNDLTSSFHKLWSKLDLENSHCFGAHDFEMKLMTESGN